jgi:hypothetical protein
MTMFYDYRTISADQFTQLEESLTAENTRDLLSQFLDIKYEDEKKQKIALDYHFYNYTFCKDKGFDGRKTTTFLSIMHTIFLRDTESISAADTIESSYAFFQETLLQHCVERVPYNIKIFDEKDVGPIIDFVTESYYRQFRLFNYIYGSLKRLQLKQVMPNEVEIVPSQQPLSNALKLQ